jgi:hypothetical protein
MSAGVTQLWKWRSYGNQKTISTGAWKSRTEREIPTFPQLMLLFSAAAAAAEEHEHQKVLPMYPV